MLDCATGSKKDTASLSRDRGIVELLMVKAFKQPSVVQGLVQFLQAEATSIEAQSMVEKVRELVAWGVKVAADALAAGEDVSRLVS